MFDIVVQGLGELGRLLAGGAARAGFRVTPLIRGSDPVNVLATVPRHTPVLVCVAESDLRGAIHSLPVDRHSDVVLLQNELFPDVWQALGLTRPTVMVPWMLQKKGLPTRVLQATPIGGPHRQTVVAIHQALGLPCRPLDSESELEDALAAKWSFILVVNALGALENRTMGAWLAAAPDAITKLTADAVAIAAHRLGRNRDALPRLREAIVPQIAAGMSVLADIPAAGRTAASRVQNALEWAEAHGVDAPALRSIQAGRLP